MSTQTDRERLQQMAEQIFDLMVLSWVPEPTFQDAQPDLSEPEILTLQCLSRLESMSVGQLQEMIQVSPTKMSRVIRRLEREVDEPLIECSLNPKDRRKYDVSITKTGKKVFNEFRMAKLAGIMGVLEDMPESDRNDFMRLLNDIYQRLLQLHLSRRP